MPYAATVNITLEDSNGMRTSRRYEARSAAITDAQANAVADALQTITQLEVVDVQISRRVTGFTPTAAEANSSVAETASVRCQQGDGDYSTLNLPALKTALKNGVNVIGSHADLKAFLNQFDNGDGTAGSSGVLYLSDGEELSEAYIEADNVTGKVNR